MYFVLLELSDIEESWVDTVKLSLEIFDYCAMTVYVLEIVLKWIDNFQCFWHSRWNIFDFGVTFVVRDIIVFMFTGTIFSLNMNT